VFSDVSVGGQQFHRNELISVTIASEVGYKSSFRNAALLVARGQRPEATASAVLWGYFVADSYRAGDLHSTVPDVRTIVLLLLLLSGICPLLAYIPELHALTGGGGGVDEFGRMCTELSLHE
jgi:hypothetical protein